MSIGDLSPDQRAEVSEILERHLKTFREEMKGEMNENFRLSDDARDELKYMIASFMLDESSTTKEIHAYISGYLAGYQSGRYD
jgi:hypothetical protein